VERSCHKHSLSDQNQTSFSGSSQQLGLTSRPSHHLTPLAYRWSYMGAFPMTPVPALSPRWILGGIQPSVQGPHFLLMWPISRTETRPGGVWDWGRAGEGRRERAGSLGPRVPGRQVSKLSDCCPRSRLIFDGQQLPSIKENFWAFKPG
jgi:hypothetical protein